MALKTDVKNVVVKKPVRQKLIVAQGRAFGTPEVPYKVLHTEIVGSVEEAKVREKELKEEYKDIDAVSVNYFSL